MSESTLHEGETPSREKMAGPGAQLRVAREARKLTVETVSSRLHVDAAIVHALEEDDYSKFAAPIFVTGHLRAYARLLELPPEPLIDAYHHLGVDTPPPLKQVRRRVSFGANASLVPGVIVAVILGLAVAVFAGLQNGGRGNDLPAADNDLALPAAPAPGSPPGNVIDETPPPDVPADGVTGEGDNIDSAATPAPALPPPPAAAAPRATLSLKADQASWVEVRDAAGRRLLYDLLDPGASRDVEGIAPFTVLLGYGPGVTVEFNGKLVDHSRYMRDDVARFRVGEQGMDKL